MSPSVKGPGGWQAASLARRGFLVHSGRGALAVAVLGPAACAADDEVGPAQAAPACSGFAAGLAWYRVDLAYVSDYVHVRGRQAAAVDTGYVGSADPIGAALEVAGTGWDCVRHVLVTHAHGDHAGGLDHVAERATGATLYTGAADLDMIASPPPGPPGSPVQDTSSAQRLRAVADGEDVFGLRVVTTPGHTPGHIAVFDADSSVLVGGDAPTNTVDGMLAGALPIATVDQDAAADSGRKLAALDPRVILVGHGPPVDHDAATRLRRLAGSLT